MPAEATPHSEDRTAIWREAGYHSTLTLADHMRRGVEKHPRVAMHFVGGPEPTTVDLAELHGRSLDLAAGLQRLGIGPGDAIAVWVPNWAEGAITYQAAFMLGATVVPIIHIYGPQEVGFILRNSGAKVLVMPDRWRNIDYSERFDALTDTSALEQVLMVGEGGPAGALRWSDVAAADRAHLELPAVSSDDVCLLIYTSGTTADPKGVQHSHNTLMAEILTTAEAIASNSTVNLAAFPAGHIAGVLGVLRMFVLGTSTVLMDQWDAALAARLVDEYGVQSSAGAPFFLASMLDEAERQGTSLGSLTNYMVGAASVPATLVERADAAGVPAYRGYGSSEHPVITTGRPDDPPHKRAGTDGRLVPGSEIRLLDDDGDEVGSGEDGEIVSRGPDLFIGYTDPTLDAESFLAGGWFRTGDIGRFDTDGYLTVTDRKKDVIIRGGENIASKEVEDILARHAAIIEAAVVSKPDERYGERVAAFVRLRETAELTLDDVRDHFARAGVARQKTPEHLVIVNEFPRSMSGKIRKIELREQLWRGSPDRR